jgi:uncharacterized membrane protein YeaQ/YmgE (transglycosylase-associated protein family)
LKILFPKYASNTLLARKRGTPCIISLLIIAFFAGLCGGYLLENNFSFLAIMMLGIAGILVAGTVSFLLNGTKVDGARGTRIKKNARQNKSGWDYRPRNMIRPYAGADSARAQTSEVLSPESFAINNNVWLNNGSLECAARTFMNLEAMVEDATTKAPLSDHKSTVSAYD